MLKVLRVVHRWLGLVLALPLLVQGLSGAVLTLEPVWPGGEAGLAVGAPAGANAVLAAARGVAPGMRAARYVPGEPGAAARVYFVAADAARGPQSVVRVDPSTAVVLEGPSPAGGVLNWVKRLHNTLLVPELGGRQIAGWFGVGLLALTVIGVPLWWPAPGRLRAAVTVPRGARGVRLHRALHGAAGAWLVAMLLATSVTGIVQGFPQTSRAVLGLPAGGPPRAGRGGGAAGVPDVDAAIRLAQGALPGLVAGTVMLPAGGGEPIRLMMVPPGQGGAIVTRMVTVDGGASRVISAVGDPPAAEMAMRWAHDLHEGAGLGPVWRGLTVVVGLALPGFGATGVAMWWLRRRNRRRVDAGRVDAGRVDAGRVAGVRAGE